MKGVEDEDGFCGRDQQQKIFDHVYRHLTAEQQRWFIRIILKGQSYTVAVWSCYRD